MSEFDKSDNLIPPRTERRDAAENRQRILDAAIRLFEQHGVEQVSMNQIATEAQIGPGTLYRRYRNKSELCLDLIKDNLVMLFEDIEAYLEQNREASPELRLMGILTLFIRFRETKTQLVTGVEDTAQTSKPKSRTRSPLYDELHGLLVKHFDEIEAMRQQQLQQQHQRQKSPPNSVFKADLLLTALSSDSYLFQRDVRGYSADEIVEHLCATFIGI
ncbi:TetR/AcrR family transcriptional regulator [Paenibacillus albus]|uniref:TetR/AcrR family transcriptional regulator n=1 Tax=Paenibacillus albus TaxID=2495582 RepID=A0A3S9A606_9BACL|nr:TetR/AcrR family transcriptional regulator [Paenibacillus albus]AZN41168.1 TetR/AcrR family transcriptional regulator [Paenibacillus albus]